MTTCNNCLYIEACKSQVPRTFWDSETFCEDCKYFKDKSRYIELPCKVGDTVYYITGIGHNLVKPAKVKEIIIDENGIKDLYVQGDGHNFENSFDIFFLTREDTEKAFSK